MIYFLLGYVAFVIFVRYLEYKTIFIPSKAVLFTPKDKDLEYEDVYFKSKIYDLNGWFIPGTRNGSTLIYMHGNAGSIGDRLDKIKMFHDLGLNVFIFDYRGYGNSQGFSNEASLYKDSEMAYEYLLGRLDVDPDKIIGYGASLGGAVAIDLALKKRLSGIIIDSTFTSVAEMATRIYPMIPTALISIKLDSVSKIKNVKIPKLFIHSSEDEVVPYAMGEKLFNLAVEPKELITIKGGHNDAHWHDQDSFIGAIKDFLTKQSLY